MCWRGCTGPGCPAILRAHLVDPLGGTDRPGNYPYAPHTARRSRRQDGETSAHAQPFGSVSPVVGDFPAAAAVADQPQARAKQNPGRDHRRLRPRASLPWNRTSAESTRLACLSLSNRPLRNRCIWPADKPESHQPVRASFRKAPMRRHDISLLNRRWGNEGTTEPPGGNKGHAAAPSGVARSIRSRSRGLFIASHRSSRRWTLRQKSGLLPKTRARISAVAALTCRRSLHSS